MKRLLAFALGLIVTFCSTQAGYAQQHHCTDAESRRAIDEVAMLRSWDALYSSYRSYRQCDDDAIGEGYSQSVIYILVEHWRTLPQLGRLVKNDARFRRFVLGHLDATVNIADVQMVKHKARTQCPSDLRTFCYEIARQADSAIKESV
jgi:hypothetical protein